MTGPLPPVSPPSKSRFIFAGLFLIALGAAISFWALPPSGQSSPVRVQVKRGSSARDIALRLKDAGLIRHPWSFLVWARTLGHARIRPGVYELSPRDSGYAYYRQLVNGPPRVRVTFPEGWTAKQMADLLEQRGVTSAQEYLALVTQEKREGFLFPDTYLFDQSASARAIVDRQVERFREMVPSDFEDQAKALKLSYGQLVTLASIVEREAQAPQERPIIAGVFYNRLRKRMYLESCATVEYALGRWKSRLLYKDLQVDSPYNTYRHAGLPPGPISNPGVASLEAAAHPDKTDMLFFVADGQGTHRFSRYYNEHLKARKKRKS